MLLILEIVLTVAAWRAGWKALALLPLAAAVSIGFLLGMTGGENLLVPALILDFGAVVVLGLMAHKGRTQNTSTPAIHPASSSVAY